MENKIIAKNSVAYHEYFVLETVEAGIVLDGGEVKSVKNGAVNLKESFCAIENGELFLKNMHVAVYDKAGAFNTKNSRRNRKILLHKEEIVRLNSKVQKKGLTLVPIKIYLKKALIKIELGLCQGKHTFDKKRDLKEKDIKRESERAINNKNL